MKSEKKLNGNSGIDKEKLYNEKKIFEFVSKAVEVCKNSEMDKKIEFTCPICKGKAIAYVSSYNGHKKAYCDTCKCGLME